MTEYPHYELDAVTQDVFDLMRRQPGDSFSPEELASQLGYQPQQMPMALHQLLDLGFVMRASEGSEAYIVSPAAPEL